MKGSTDNEIKAFYPGRFGACSIGGRRSDSTQHTDASEAAGFSNPGPASESRDAARSCSSSPFECLGNRLRGGIHSAEESGTLKSNSC